MKPFIEHFFRSGAVDEPDKKDLITISSRLLVFFMISAVSTICFGQAENSEKEKTTTEVTAKNQNMTEGSGKNSSVDPKVQEIVKENAKSKFVPGIVAAIAEKGKPLRIAAAGVLKNKTQHALLTTHRIHLGSCTKAMTTALIARLVDQGKLTWKTSVVQGAPHLKELIHQDYHNITLEELLSHQSGLPANARNWWLSVKKPAREARLDILKDNLSKPIGKKARGKFLYSNLGYMLAGYMAATREDTDWESLVKKEVFDPLKMRSAGFGPPSVDKKINQPWGHTVSFIGSVSPSQIDNAPALGPAGTAHMTISDWSKFGLAFAMDQKELNQLQTDSIPKPYLTAKSIRKIGSLLDNDVSRKSTYGLGWLIMDRKWSNGKVMFHNGSNTTWYAEIWIAPERKMAVLAVSNSAGMATTKYVRKTVTELIKLWKKELDDKTSKKEVNEK